jgi:hypothetical protein
MNHPGGFAYPIPRFLIPVLLLTVVHVGFHLMPWHPVVAYSVTLIGGSIIFLWLAVEIRGGTLGSPVLVALLLLSLLLRGSFFAVPPIGSDDVYRYVWDGKVQAAGIDPYQHAPASESLTRLHSADLPARVNHPDMKTVYFPFTQWIFFLAYAISGEALWGLKLLIMIAEALTLGALYLLTQQLSVPRVSILLYAFCPLPILMFGLDAHVDAIGLPLVLWGLLLVLRRRMGLGVLLISLSVSVKPVPLLLLPVLFLMSRGARQKMTIVLVPILTIGLQFLPYLISGNPFEALVMFTRHWTFNGVVFEMVNAVLRDNQPSRLLCAALLVLALVPVYVSRWEPVRKYTFAVLLLLLFSPVVHPWYVTWLTVLLPLVPLRAGVVFSSTVSLTVLTVVTYTLHGRWEEYPLVYLAEYLPVGILLIRDLFTGSGKGSSTGLSSRASDPEFSEPA